MTTAEAPTPSESDGPRVVRVREGVLVTVSRVVGIARDIVIIALIVALLTLGGSVLSAVRQGAAEPVSVPAPGVSCPGVEVDEWGTFCPSAPGG